MEPTLTQTSTFIKLPTTLQLNILKYLYWTDQQNLRLVCKHTSALINYLGAPIPLRLDEDLSSFEKLKTCPFRTVGSIIFCTQSKSLPICSSTRSQIPRASEVYIASNVSPDAVLELIRYYVKWSSRLIISNTKFPYMKNIKTFGSSRTCMANIKYFYFCYTHYTDIFTPRRHDLIPDLNAFGQFLDWASMPSLEKLEMRFDCEYVVIPNHNKFFQNFPKFLARHAQQLKYLMLWIPLNIWHQIIPTFALMTNLKKLVIVESSQLIGEDLILKAFNSFTTLTSLHLEPENPKLLQLLLENNKTTIQSLRTVGITSLSWLYQFQYPFNSLTYLNLDINYRNSSIFDKPQAEYKFKLETLRKLSIGILPHYEQGRELDWRESLINWLIQIEIMPNLDKLTLVSYSQ